MRRVDFSKLGGVLRSIYLPNEEPYRYVLDDNKLKKIILREFHLKLYSGHPGFQKTLTMVKKFYYWPNLKKEVVELVVRCLDCQ